MKTGNIILAGMISVVVAACSDDYNTIPQDSSATAGLSLWENIKSNSQLKDFAALAEQTGYADELQGSKVFTVWAPLDGTYDAQAIQAWPKDDILNRFLKNHVAAYSQQLKKGEQKRIHTLNSKSFDFSESIYGDQKVENVNIPARNGVLHTINGQQHFYPNLYEYITTAEGIDSVKAYYKRFERTSLDENASVLGPVVGGKQTYIDSVIVKSNQLFRRLNAHINTEDSSYTALLPDNSAWDKAYGRIRSYFNYANKTVSQDLSLENVTTTKTKNLNATLFGDSLTRNAIMGNIFFNNNNRYNRWLTDPQDIDKTDTLCSTNGTLLPNGPEMLSRTVSMETMSNGVARVVDSLALDRATWAQDIIVSVNSSSYRPRTLSAVPQMVRLSEEDKSEGMDSTIVSYVDLVPTGSRSLPDVFFYIPEVLSTTYEIFAVIVPPTIRKDFEGVAKPNKFLATLTYCNANGVIQTKSLGDSFISNPEKVDWISLGRVTFPIAYKGLGAFYPSIEIKSNLRIFNATEMNTYDRELRIAAIVLRPVL